jgi:23S rRNA pseudouridine2457 synthase
VIVRFNKPYGVLTQFTDRDGRPTLADYIAIKDIYAAGRLDFDSEGLLLLTDDGALAKRLTDPAFFHPRTYLVQVEHIPNRAALDALRGGVTIQGYQTRPAEVALLPGEPDLPPRIPPIRARQTVPTAWIRLTITEGKNRQVRHMTAAVGHPTLRLVRVAIGPVTLDGLLPGAFQVLSPQAARDLHRAISKAHRENQGRA